MEGFTGGGDGSKFIKMKVPKRREKVCSYLGNGNRKVFTGIQQKNYFCSLNGLVAIVNSFNFLIYDGNSHVRGRRQKRHIEVSWGDFFI